MSFENKQQEPRPSQPIFDVEAANRERLEWRVGGKAPTERALGRDEDLARYHAKEVDDVRAEHTASQRRLDERLGGIASQELRPDDN